MTLQGSLPHKWRNRFQCAALCLASILNSSAGPPRKGEIILEATFEEPHAAAGWHGPVALLPGKSGQALQVARTKTSFGGSAMVGHTLPVERVRGCKITATAQVRARDVSPKPKSHNGVKFMLIVEAPTGNSYPQASLDTGSHDWRQAGFTTVIPADATKLQLFLGLEAVTGEALFDNVQVVVVRPPAIAPAPVPAKAVQPITRLRGAMVGPRVGPEDLRVLGSEWNANLIRWQFIRTGRRPGEPVSIDDYDAWIAGELARLDGLLPVCREAGLRVALDLHSPPGGKATSSGYVGSDDRLFTDRICQAKFIEVWRVIAKHYRGEPAIWAFDLANEPVEDYVAEGCEDWPDLALRAGRAIREIDPDRTLIVEASPWGSPDSLAGFTPLPLENIVYSAHMYVPHAFTHQGVHANRQEAFVYPGEIEGRFWDKAALEQALKPVGDFQQRYGVPIYLGEFSAIRWAPEGSAFRYLRDVIDIFEAHGWDWSYHAFREWQGWSVEHGDDREDTRPSGTPTARERLLREAFARNAKNR